MKELREKISIEIESLLSDSMYHAIDGLGYVFHSTPDGYNKKEIFLEAKLEAMNKLNEQVDLGLINEEDAKKEFIKIKFMKGGYEK